jgi:hypothetical protein
MGRRGLIAASALAAAAIVTPLAGAVLTPAEQSWLAPLITIWNVQNDHLKVVVAQAEARDALIVGERPANETLTYTLAALASCKQPKDLIKQAGAPPSARLAGFRSELDAACVDDLDGANDFAKAIGAVREANYSLETALLKSGLVEFGKGRDELARAYLAVVSVGGKVVFKA